MLMMGEQRAFNATVEKKSMLFKSTKLYLTYKNRKKGFYVTSWSRWAQDNILLILYTRVAETNRWHL